jgi:uncharacterized protein (TIGR02246 family)
MMKNIFLLFLLNVAGVVTLYSQQNTTNEVQQKAITALIDQYSEAREKNDTILLKKILTADVDQLVSNGEWRTGIAAAIEGMLKSSGNNPGTRTLTIETIRMLSPTAAITDCRYEIQNTNGTVRKMWSTFIVVADKGVWKISAIRNMLPASS